MFTEWIENIIAHFRVATCLSFKASQQTETNSNSEMAHWSLIIKSPLNDDTFFWSVKPVILSITRD